jgi:tetratricopeptide (TPR) repeat protein
MYVFFRICFVFFVFIVVQFFLPLCAFAPLREFFCILNLDHRTSTDQSEEISMPDPVKLYDEADKLKDAGQLDEAVAKLEEALAADPNYALAHSALAIIQQKRGRHEEAIAHARKVCDIEPTDPFSFTALSVTYQRAFAGTNNMNYIRLAEDAMEQSRILQSRH